MTSRREGTQPHIPRLAYRNSPSTGSVSGHSTRTVGTQSSAASNSAYATSPPTSSFSGSPRSYRFSEDVCSPLSLDGTSDQPPSSPFLSSQTAKEPKKKSSSLFKFFSVKEPSTQAFETYHEQMKKRGTTGSGRANAVGLPGVSSAKLPPTVPKVNSKWDGVPRAAKDKSKEKANASRQSLASSLSRPLYTSRSTGTTMTTMTLSSISSTRSEIRGNGKLRLNDSSANLADLYGWEAPSVGTSSSGSSTRSFPLESRGSTTTAPTLQRQRTSFFPQSPSILATAYDSPAETPPPLDPSSNRPSPIITPSLPSPPTPKDTVPHLPWSSSISSPGNMPTKESLLPNKNVVILNSSGTNVLGPPVSATRKPEVTSVAAGEAIRSTLPSEASSRPPLQPPSSILKRPTEASAHVQQLQTPPDTTEKIARPSPAVNPTKSKKLHVMSMFSKDVKA
ncbi:MAG: hypothetical protein Q9186_007358 [Xanthomendoza sp. 1 TL-2023]